MSDMFKRILDSVLKIPLLQISLCIFAITSNAEKFDSELIKFYKDPKHAYAVKYKTPDPQDKLYYIAPISDLKEYYSNIKQFVVFKESSDSKFTTVFFDDLIKMRYEIVCEDKHDSLLTTWTNVIFNDKAFNPTNKSFTNNFYFERIDKQLYFLLYASHYIVNLNPIPIDYEYAKYIKCVDDSLGCSLILDEKSKLCATCYEVETLTKAQTDAFLKSIVNVSELDATVMNCIFVPRDGIVLYKKRKPIFNMEISFYCNGISFQNLETQKANFTRFKSTNIFKNPLYTKMIEINDGECSKLKREEIEYHNLKIKELKYELSNECK